MLASVGVAAGLRQGKQVSSSIGVVDDIVTDARKSVDDEWSVEVFTGVEGDRDEFIPDDDQPVERQGIFSDQRGRYMAKFTKKFTSRFPAVMKSRRNQYIPGRFISPRWKT
jgi:hypothetical protein